MSEPARIEADPTVPAIHIYRDFRATPAQLVRAHTDPELVPLWMGPARRTMEVDYWDPAVAAAGDMSIAPTASNSASMAASTRSASPGSCRRSRSRGCPRRSRWRPWSSRISVTV
ncbi:hypothetical protein BN13_1910003 [Nostocoides jenkinsii Ben 74]|uniref:Activator of Hsp90 ATPase 1 family protein n=1 Tax=Nostocoides jenkinsii Ben 74 TaxID=1193518 RepID=A0A077M9X1_9MICO|nr:hypothetical protein BN13_1910003 [Tetrasphaera jenkinsii Ben 74]